MHFKQVNYLIGLHEAAVQNATQKLAYAAKHYDFEARLRAAHDLHHAKQCRDNFRNTRLVELP